MRRNVCQASRAQQMSSRCPMQLHPTASAPNIALAGTAKEEPGALSGVELGERMLSP